MPKDKKEKLLPKYRGWLTASEIAEGMNASGRNARRLYADAKLLYDHGRYPSALGLACLSIEESAKVSLLRGFATAQDIDVIKRRWKEFRNHSYKTLPWVWLALFSRKIKEMGGLDPGPEVDQKETETLLALKEISFYVDCNGNKHWAEPDDVIDEGACKAILETARIFSESDSVVTTREVELWAKFVGEDESDAKNLIRWHQAMLEEGLSNWTQDEFVRFIDAYILERHRSASDGAR